jgi:Xaa-Pro aminopeptidase
MVHRVAPGLKCRDLKAFKVRGRRIGYESSMPHAQFLKLRKLAPRGAKFVDVADDLLALRAVKTPDEVGRIRAAESLACEIWNEASAKFRAGMTERDMARIIQKLMVERGEGEAFDTIVCVGRNAAECHHEPDDTVWNGREPVLVDMGVKLGGVCSDLTRNLVPGLLTVGRGAPRPPRLYKQVYALVKEANAAAIAAARPGMTGRALDKVARDVIRKGGFGKCFGHSLGHGVGYEIHEAPYASKKSKTVLKPGMCVTIEPGVYLEDNLGVRIEDLVLITEDGCEVLSTGAAK